ncbi:bacillithiol biosynthesis deacetylase BshB2 [Alicyclobacillus ferrooxydans]|uniref:Deacetylase n=1 Tax=Alicyclobacillus ferrooxydans TaxID=471514 RepID=A0A0P9CG31_9BACL|nr:bacillithiol biosynthesis deacetylase BshB2 [Alicyclobacillus ferrooxydans]KPV44737.1 deacetylase [Alicyclobacillus ferrooxydans]
MERHVLVLFPHPDDETLAVGGTVAHHAQAGSPVTYGCFTLGQMGRNMGKPFFATRESLPVIRQKELKDAAEALGIQDLRMLGFRDKTLEFEDPEIIISIITGLIDELNPSLIITYYPNYCVHPDHEAIARCTIEALRRIPADKRPKLQCVAFARGHQEALGEKDVIMDNSAVWEKKYLAIKAHKTQTAPRVAEIEAGLSGDPEERERIIESLSKEELYTFQV